MRTTASGTPTSVGSNSQWNALTSDATSIIGGINLWMTNYNSTVTGGSSKYVAAFAGDGSAVQFGNQWETKLSGIVNTSAALGANDNFFTVSGNSAGSRAAMSITAVLGTWNLSSAGTLSYSTASVAAVPEANTSAMMIAGLALMGFVARRRRS